MSMLWCQSDEGMWESRDLDYLAHAHDGAAMIRLEDGVGLLARRACDVRVNGQPVPGGFQILRHQDEVAIDRVTYYLSSHRMPAATRFQQAERPTNCPVCRGRMENGTEAVQCPGCQRWYHQIEATGGRLALRCWTYSETCRFCGHPTDLDGRHIWRPDALV